MRYAVLLLAAWAAAAEDGVIRVRLTWGHEAARSASHYVRLEPAVYATAHGLEPGEGFQDGAWRSMAGGGDIDGIDFALAWPAKPVSRLQNLHIIWADLIAAAEPDAARRLGRDAAFEPGSPRLAVFTSAAGDRGFTVAAGQLRTERDIWLPSLGMYLAAGDSPTPFAAHRVRLESLKGRRILDGVRRRPEASYRQYTALWEDMGNPAYVHPQQPRPGHIVCLTWDSALAKFGIDRGAGVWNDYGNPDRFQFWFDFADLAKGIAGAWKGQRLEDGLPVITTVLERDGVRYQVEQFAFPLDGPPATRQGDIPMVLLQRVRLRELRGVSRTVPVTMAHRRRLGDSTAVSARSLGDALLFEDDRGRALLTLQGAGAGVAWSGVRDYQKEMTRIDATAFVLLAAGGAGEFIVKLPSPMAGPEAAARLAAIDYAAARAAALDFWSGWVKRGAQFRVPEKAVNDLFRASLWHALRLPRRHGGAGDNVDIDLPYSNFAYSQTGTPWPVNQAVYVDYMLYSLRGYFDVAAEELRVQYRNNQEAGGRVKGYANWLVYTPGMLYATAWHYMLSRDRAAFDALLPQSLSALDYCLGELRRAGGGLVAGPLNDGTGQGVWAFNQAYLHAGMKLFGEALKDIGHPRAEEALSAAGALREAIGREFGAASARSPLVQLRDGTWSPYVPGEARTPGRMLDQWYATDVDTGPVHLLRLNALDARGPLADALLNDHEDNLFYKNRGMANEPVYNQQATAYLLRDEPEAAIRAFYSYMACAFSHSVFEPVEHRWTHGQYFGPPSTDGAWFELYRNMLVRETEEGGLLLGQAAPRKWLEDGQLIEVSGAPTRYGTVSMKIESRAKEGRIAAGIEFRQSRRPRELLVRLRHPRSARLRSVMLDGKEWKDFDPAREWIRIPSPARVRYRISAGY